MQILAYLISVHFWWTLHQTQISFSTAELCHDTQEGPKAVEISVISIFKEQPSFERALM